jgi:hypothetical protein
MFQRETIKLFATPQARYEHLAGNSELPGVGGLSDTTTCQPLCLALSLLSVSVKALLEFKVSN